MAPIQKHTGFPGSKEVNLRFKISKRPAKQSKVLIRIYNFDCHVEEINSLLKLNPTQGWQKGDLIPNKRSVYRKQSRWELLSSVSQKDDVCKHIDFLINVVEQKKKAFKILVSKYEGELAIVFHITEHSKARINLSKDLIGRIAALGLAMDFDLHFHPPYQESH